MSEQVHKPLKEHHLPASGCSLLNTFKPKNVTATDPAEAVMTDLRKVASASIRAEASLERAHQMMIQRGVRMLMVANDEGLISGVITSNDVMGEKPLTVAQKHGIKRGELKVRDIMIDTNHVQVLQMSDVVKAEVGNVIATLKQAGRAHALVVDQVNGKLSLIGIFSANQIARQMGIQIHTHEVARTFAEIEAVLVGV
jgi:CBS-domain-containing membrane protein